MQLLYYWKLVCNFEKVFDMNLETIRAMRNEADQKYENATKQMDALLLEQNRIINIASNAKDIISNIDDEFESVTALSTTDMSYVLFATMLQTLRWILMKPLEITRMEELTPSISKDERLRSREKNHIGGIYDGRSSGSEYEHEAVKDYIGKKAKKAKQSEDEFYNRNNCYRSWIEIITQPVPYDALNSLDKNSIPNIANINKRNSEGLYSNIYGNNHHVLTLGHDPVLGWIFGTANIMTSKISFVDFQSYRVQRGHKIKALGEFVPNNELMYSDQVIDYLSPCTIPGILYECLLSAREDWRRIVAAVAKQAMHFQSDKYCIEGLPIPILPVLNTKKAQELIEKGWNSVEFEILMEKDLKQIGLSTCISILINLIIEVIYLLSIDADEELDVRQIKIKKILSISNTIATSSNILHVALSKEISKLDIGGMIATLLELFHSAQFISAIKAEYIRGQFERQVMKGV